jgi:hypothetical protein
MFTLGADPEVFVGKNGLFVSAHGLVPGDKANPFLVDKGAVQVDGMALEFNIDPVINYEQFQDHLDTVFSTLKDMVPDYEILHQAAVELDPTYKLSLPEDVLQIGCNPDFNAYTEEMNKSPDETCDIRAAGGHLHIGGIFSPEDTSKARYSLSLRLARLLDKHVGVYSVIWDKDTLRRKVYGAAGSLRFKDYGIEYRSLSNSWLFNPKITKFVYEGVTKAVEELREGKDVEGEVYRHIIDNYDKDHSFFTGNEKANFLKEAV